jgi:predicted nucleotidyltransferase
MKISDLTKLEEQILFRTEVGSGMWGMNDLSSDIDIITVYKTPTRDILMGKRQTNVIKPQRKYYVGDVEIDEQFMEIGHLINLLCKGNINALWAVTSPIVIQDYMSYNHKLSTIVKHCGLSKAILPSALGMAESQWRDAEKRADVKSPIKSKSTAMRTLLFACRVLRCNDTIYDSVHIRDYCQYEYDSLINTTTDMHGISKIQDLPNEPILRQWLLSIRLQDIKLCGGCNNE